MEAASVPLLPGLANDLVGILDHRSLPQIGGRKSKRYGEHCPVRLRRYCRKPGGASRRHAQRSQSDLHRRSRSLQRAITFGIERDST